MGRVTPIPSSPLKLRGAFIHSAGPRHPFIVLECRCGRRAPRWLSQGCWPGARKADGRSSPPAVRDPYDATLPCPGAPRGDARNRVVLIQQSFPTTTLAAVSLRRWLSWLWAAGGHLWPSGPVGWRPASSVLLFPSFGVQNPVGIGLASLAAWAITCWRRRHPGSQPHHLRAL